MQTDPNQKRPKGPHTKAGALNPSSPRAAVTGNFAGAVDTTGKPATSGSAKLQSECTLPKWLDTNPSVLAGQLDDLLRLMRTAGWFSYILPVTIQKDDVTGITAIRITICPKPPFKIGVVGPVNEQVITIDDKPVTLSLKGQGVQDDS